VQVLVKKGPDSMEVPQEDAPELVPQELDDSDDEAKDEYE